jgi:hypothetical protein
MHRIVVSSAVFGAHAFAGLKPFSPIRNGRQFTRGGNRQNQARFSSADRYDQSRRQNGLHMNRSHLNMCVVLFAGFKLYGRVCIQARTGP